MAMARYLFSYLRLRLVGLRVKRYRLQALANPVDLIPLPKTAAAEWFFHAFNTDGRNVVWVEGYGAAAGHTRSHGPIVAGHAEPPVVSILRVEAES